MCFYGLTNAVSPYQRNKPLRKSTRILLDSLLDPQKPSTTWGWFISKVHDNQNFNKNIPPKIVRISIPKTKTTVKFDQDFPITISFSFDHGTSAKFGKSLRSPRHHKRTACRKSVDRGMVNW